MFCIDIEWVNKARKWRCSVTFGGCEYNNLYWTSFEKLIDDEDPSPSCYSQKRVSTDNTDPENESDSDELDRYHSGEQDEICIWDYVAQIEKISKASDRQKSDDNDDSEDDENDDT